MLENRTGAGNSGYPLLSRTLTNLGTGMNNLFIMEKNNQDTNNIDPAGTKIIACATVIEEVLPIMPLQMSYEVLDFGLHINPAELKISLQKVIDAVPAGINNIILGYGLCSQAVVGLKSDRSTLIVPRVDDCIAIFLGSKAAYRREQRKAPGTYYLTKGWLKTAGTPFDDFDRMAAKYGEDAARRIMRRLLQNYTRLAFINTGTSGLEEYHARAAALARRFDLSYEEIPGEGTLVYKMIFGPRDDEILVVKAGRTIALDDFMPGPAL